MCLQIEAEEMRAEVLRLNQQLKEANAKEFALDSATKQNSELLKLLMKTETDCADVRVDVMCSCILRQLIVCLFVLFMIGWLQLRDALDAAKRELADFKELHTVRIKEMAEASARASKFERDARMTKEELEFMKSTVGVQLSQVSTQLDDTTKTAAVQLDTMADELRLRREKQYELLDKIRHLEEELDGQGRDRESMAGQVTALQQRNLDLEAQLMASNKHREAQAKSAAEVKAMLEGEIERLRASLKVTAEEGAVAKGQLTQLSASVVKLAEKERGVQEQLEKANERARAREGEIAVLNERVAQLVDEGESVCRFCCCYVVTLW